jgi:hypothetical protein
MARTEPRPSHTCNQTTRVSIRMARTEPRPSRRCNQPKRVSIRPARTEPRPSRTCNQTTDGLTKMQPFSQRLCIRKSVSIEGGEGSARTPTNQHAFQSDQLECAIKQHAYQSAWLGRSLDPPERATNNLRINPHGSDGASTLPHMQPTRVTICMARTEPRPSRMCGPSEHALPSNQPVSPIKLENRSLKRPLVGIFN